MLALTFSGLAPSSVLVVLFLVKPVEPRLVSTPSEDFRSRVDEFGFVFVVAV